MNSNSKNIIIVNKPKGVTSFWVVNFIKKKFNYKKVGHAGTLDPNATGVLILGVNEGTKELSNLLLDNKEYIATIQFGYRTDSYDIEGKIIETTDKKVSIEEIRKYLDNLYNVEIYQTPPIYSAIKVNGKKLYEYARENREVKIEQRKVKIIENEIISFDDQKQILVIRLFVSKGFYIRSFANDIGLSLNNFATLIDLQRTKSGNFSLNDAIDIDWKSK